jgi:hypothetical protein
VDNCCFSTSMQWADVTALLGKTAGSLDGGTGSSGYTGSASKISRDKGNGFILRRVAKPRVKARVNGRCTNPNIVMLLFDVAVGLF